MSPQDFLVRVSGPDHAALAARLTGVLAEHAAELRDVELVALQGRATLCLHVRVPPGCAALPALTRAGEEAGAHVEVEPLGPAAGQGGARYVVTAIARGLSTADVHALFDVLAQHGVRCERVEQLSEAGLRTVELRVRLPEGTEPAALKKALLELGMKSAFDVALQRESLFRRSKRLVVMDMDSTLIRVEVIDELARAHGVVEQVSHITERAMQGEMDYDQSLRERVALLRGLDAGVLDRLAQNLPLTEGAETLVRVLKRLGLRTAVISGGFSVAAHALKSRLGLDHAYSNVLEVGQDGRLTGRVVGGIINAQRKAELLESIAREEGILLDQTVAVGDGANDLLMLQKAGLGIAFRAKPRLREAADTSLSASGLDAVLALLGLSERDLREAEQGGAPQDTGARRRS